MLRIMLAAALFVGLSAASAAGADLTALQGKVKELHRSPKGDVDGLTLADGAAIRFPPHVGKQVSAVVSVGDEVKVAAEKHVGPKEGEHLRATTITNVKTGDVVKCDVPPPDKKPKDAPPPGKKPKDAPPPEKKPKKEPKVEEKSPSRPEEAKGEKHPLPPHEQILVEVRAIKTLVDGGRSAKSNEASEPVEGPPHERIIEELRQLRTQLERRLNGEKR